VLNSVLPMLVIQYNMTHTTLPQSPHVILPDLEAIKHTMNEKHRAKLKSKAKECQEGKPQEVLSDWGGGSGEQVPKK
jgi:hypothetical protein